MRSPYLTLFKFLAQEVVIYYSKVYKHTLIERQLKLILITGNSVRLPVDVDSVMKSSEVLGSEFDLDEVVPYPTGSDPHGSVVFIGQGVDPYARDCRARRSVVRFDFLKSK